MIATPIVIFVSDMNDGTGDKPILTLFGGISASLFVFCFVPYIPKYYLSELMVVTFAFGFVMMLLVNAAFPKPPVVAWVQTTWMTTAIFSALFVPFVTYGILEWRRPIHERIANNVSKTEKFAQHGIGCGLRDFR